jgi:hypothetical protein
VVEMIDGIEVDVERPLVVPDPTDVVNYDA